MTATPAQRAAAHGFLARWEAASRRERERMGGRLPVAALQAVALDDPDPWVRRDCLSLLDHHAHDRSAGVFRQALHDPVPPVRELALHGLACERCGSEPVWSADVVPDLVEVLAGDPSPEVRHKALAALVGFAVRDGDARRAIAHAAQTDGDALVREAASRVVEGGYLPSRERLRRRATSRRGKAQPRTRQAH